MVASNPLRSATTASRCRPCRSLATDAPLEKVFVGYTLGADGVVGLLRKRQDAYRTHTASHGILHTFPRNS